MDVGLYQPIRLDGHGSPTIWAARPMKEGGEWDLTIDQARHTGLSIRRIDKSTPPEGMRDATKAFCWRAFLTTYKWHRRVLSCASRSLGSIP